MLSMREILVSYRRRRTVRTHPSVVAATLMCCCALVLGCQDGSPVEITPDPAGNSLTATGSGSTASASTADDGNDDGNDDGGNSRASTHPSVAGGVHRST